MTERALHPLACDDRDVKGAKATNLPEAEETRANQHSRRGNDRRSARVLGDLVSEPRPVVTLRGPVQGHAAQQYVTPAVMMQASAGGQSESIAQAVDEQLELDTHTPPGSR